MKGPGARPAVLLISFALLAGLLIVQISCGNQRQSGLPIDRIATPIAGLPGVINPRPPEHPVRLVFVHHNVGDHWLADDGGRLGLTLAANNYFVSDTDFGWVPPDYDVGAENIGDHTDIGQWYSWFAGPNHTKYVFALFREDSMHSYIPYSRQPYNPDPLGENEVVVIKSGFNNSDLSGNPDDPPVPTTSPNDLRSQDSSSENLSVANAKGIYEDLLVYFETRRDKLFVIVTAPPLVEGQTTPGHAANARALNHWLTQEWLKDYPYSNVAVFDFYNVLTSNGGSPMVNDLNRETGNHHRYREGVIQYVTSQGTDYSAYATSEDDSLPTDAGLQKASDEFVGVLNVAYNRWKRDLELLLPVEDTPVVTG